MSKLSDKTFFLILIVIGAVYFYMKSSGGNKKVDLSKVVFTVDGQNTTLDHYKGQNLVVNFYATWCRPCMKELPAMAKTANQWDDVTFLWLNNEGEEVINKSKSRFQQTTFYSLVSSFQDIGIETIPYTAIINKDGEMVYSHSGQMNWESESFKKEILDKLH